MSSRQLVDYQNQVLLKSLNSSHFNFPMPAGLKPQPAINVEASRKIMKGETEPRRLKLNKRRLLLHDSVDDREKDARPRMHRLSNGRDLDAPDMAEPSRHRLLDMDTLGEQLGYDPEKSV